MVLNVRAMMPISSLPRTAARADRSPALSCRAARTTAPTRRKMMRSLATIAPTTISRMTTAAHARFRKSRRSASASAALRGISTVTYSDCVGVSPARGVKA